MPLLPKIIVGVLVLAAFGKIISMHKHPSGDRSFNTEQEGEGNVRPRTYRPASTSNGSSQRLAQFQAQQRQLQGRMMQCKALMDQAMQQQAMAAVQGQMVNNQPPCEQWMPVWVAQEAVVETNIYRIQTGNYNATVLEVTGI